MSLSIVLSDLEHLDSLAFVSGGSYLLVNGVLQILLQPFGLGVDADLPIVLQLGSGKERKVGVSAAE